MKESENPLGALDAERVLLHRCLNALEATNVAVERADLARATAPLAARYENVLADSFYPQIVDSLGMVLDYESDELFKLIDVLGPEDEERLRQRIDEASADQTSLTDPPDNVLVRTLAEARMTFGLALNDHSTTWHPGVETVLDGPART